MRGATTTSTNANLDTIWEAMERLHKQQVDKRGKFPANGTVTDSEGDCDMDVKFLVVERQGLQTSIISRSLCD